MHKIDTPSAIAGKFVAGDPQNGQAATQINPAYMNMLQDELVAVVTAAGSIALDPPGTPVVDQHHDLLLQAINKLIAAAGDSGPHVTQLLEGKELHTTLYDTVHYRKPDGASLLRADYPAAWAAIQTSGQLAASHAAWLATPTLWGPGVDATHFNMKDLRALFRRVDNDGKAGALGPVLGGYKANQNASHTHTLPSDEADGSGPNRIANSDGGSIDHAPLTGAQGGDEANPDHTSLRYVIRMK
ncbi:hypothetical protein MMA231_00986 [Asticcacaulis sp. MM231]|uniref:hypothetical protein n=1 Tax=Asticcacaulis sp. MM231 TaxID=3157666 RepID=UPI0032D58E9F